MTRREIEDLFKTEDYDKAVLKIKNALKDDSDNGELIYYLFLAENKDYANIDLDNIVNEVNFNRAIELSNRRLRNEFEAEYNFYRDSDPMFRKMFCYASRENKEKFYGMIEEVEEAKMPEDIDTYLDNLDYLVNSRISKTTLECNIVCLNLLYILTKEERILGLINHLLPIAKDMDFRYDEYQVYDDRYDLYNFVGYLSTPIEELEEDKEEELEEIDDDYITDEEIEEGAILSRQKPNDVNITGEFINEDDDDEDNNDTDEDEEEEETDEEKKERQRLIEERRQQLIKKIIEEENKQSSESKKKAPTSAPSYSNKKSKIKPQRKYASGTQKFFMALLILFIWGLLFFIISKAGSNLIRTDGYDWPKILCDVATEESKLFWILVGIRYFFFMILCGICYALMYAVLPITLVFGTWYFGMNLLYANRVSDFEDRRDWTFMGWKFEQYLLFFMAVPSLLNIWFMWW